MKKSILIQKRKEAKKLKAKGWGIRKIARYLICSTDSVLRWLSMDDREIEKDRRGWHKGKLKKHSDIEKKRIVKLREELEMANAILVGATAIKAKYKKIYGREISEWFIYRTLRESRQKKALQYPVASEERNAVQLEKRLKELGEVVMDLSFGVANYGSRPQDTFNLLFCQYISPVKYGILSRISEFSSSEVIRILKFILRKFIRPDIVRMNFHAAFGANLSHRCCIGKLTLFLLNLGIKPLYSMSPNSGYRLNMKNGEGVFSTGFLDDLYCACRLESGIEIENFYLEFKQRSAPSSENIVTRNPFFMKAFTDEELDNRRVSRFLVGDVFFLRGIEKTR